MKMKENKLFFSVRMNNFFFSLPAKTNAQFLLTPKSGELNPLLCELTILFLNFCPLKTESTAGELLSQIYVPTTHKQVQKHTHI